MVGNRDRQSIDKPDPTLSRKMFLVPILQLVNIQRPTTDQSPLKTIENLIWASLHVRFLAGDLTSRVKYVYYIVQ